ncbi:hypothetical protein J2Y45_005875 [Dyadobacter sp. BE34]|uniref:Lipoprotein n=1 Tax=Dyadobacter fermentans TaxID=94254 RepID=A0ABU1R5J6_9BACT|nr:MULTISPECIES: hypothetical protein [Dyadobacter]MDR6808663.1 hypothetical protein [Dyadobacter fermentans]MDR7046406.1 hypothetical protein [Dyadobacter sp. BE242]MDR7200719.1 hypothetical protein [Dyadobacter sp. BE34]MDR7218679.1 hypothetical protein [Dyadobacter sp. BE31]MDR7266609.1 hypothetical protein [Dyadobacter sp. BE32]
MKRYSYIVILLLSGLLSCEKQPPVNPHMVNQVFTGEVNGVPFKTGMTVQFGASVNQEMCVMDVVAVSLMRKISEREYQRVHMNYFHTKPGKYTLTDSAVSHSKNAICILESISTGAYFLSQPEDDTPLDSYRLLEGPWNYFKVLYYDPEKSELQCQFGAKFVRINKVQYAAGAMDTITYTNSKFILSNIYVQEVFTEPR